MCSTQRNMQIKARCENGRPRKEAEPQNRRTIRTVMGNAVIYWVTAAYGVSLKKNFISNSHWSAFPAWRMVERILPFGKLQRLLEILGQSTQSRLIMYHCYPGPPTKISHLSVSHPNTRSNISDPSNISSMRLWPQRLMDS